MITDPEDHRYGRYRLPEKKVTTIDMTHVKRIRGCPTDGARVDVVITMKSKWQEVKAEETKKLQELLKDEEKMVLGEVQVPH